MNVAACLIFDGRPLTRADGRLDRARIERHVERAVLRSRRYRQRLSRSPIARRPIWIDDPDFRFSDHVRSIRLVPGAGAGTLEDICARFAATPLDRRRPLWEVRIVEDLPLGRFAIALKAHHCLADGVGGIELLRSLLLPESGRAMSAPAGARRSEPFADEILDGLDALGRSIDSGIGFLRSPRAGMEALGATLVGLVDVARLGLRPARRTILDAGNTDRRMLRWIETDLERIQRIRRARGGTVNDVVIATVALALGSYLEAHGLSREAQKRATFRVAVPVDVRAGAARPGFGNEISMLFAEIPVGEVDPLRVLDRTRESLAASKAGGTTSALRQLLDAGDRLPRALVRRAERWALASHPANIVLTNVRGPRSELALLGARLEHVVPIVPLMPGQSLAIAVASYHGRLCWGLHADAGRVADLPAWAAWVERSFEALSRAATEAAGSTSQRDILS